MGSVFRQLDNTTEELLTASESTEIVRMTIANVETADTIVHVNIFKNSKTGNTARIVGYNSEIAGYEMMTLTNIHLNEGQYLTITTDGAIDVDINYKSLTT